MHGSKQNYFVNGTLRHSPRSMAFPWYFFTIIIKGLKYFDEIYFLCINLKFTCIPFHKLSGKYPNIASPICIYDVFIVYDWISCIWHRGHRLFFPISKEGYGAISEFPWELQILLSKLIDNQNRLKVYIYNSLISNKNILNYPYFTETTPLNKKS